MIYLLMKNYKVIFMKRKMSEILASQGKMLERMGRSKDGISDEKMGEFFDKHLSKINRLDRRQKIYRRAVYRL